MPSVYRVVSFYGFRLRTPCFPAACLHGVYTNLVIMPKLTKRLVDATPFPSKGQVFVRDGTLAGFALRVTPQVESLRAGETDAGASPTTDPRAVRCPDRRASAGEGGPVERRHSGRQGSGPKPSPSSRRATLAHLLELYDERYLPRKQPTSQRHDRSLIALYLSKWRPRKLSSISRSDVARLHAEIGRTAPIKPTAAWPSCGDCTISPPCWDSIPA